MTDKLPVVGKRYNFKEPLILTRKSNGIVTLENKVMCGTYEDKEVINLFEEIPEDTEKTSTELLEEQKELIDSFIIGIDKAEEGSDRTVQWEYNKNLQTKIEKLEAENEELKQKLESLD